MGDGETLRFDTKPDTELQRHPVTRSCQRLRRPCREGLFDPMGYAKKDPKRVEELKRKEIANGRLAMVAILGCFTQAITTGTGPVDNLFYHLADPGHHNIFAQ